MKKIFIIILILPIFLLVACEAIGKVIDDVIDPDIPNFIDEIIPEQISQDFILPNRHEPYGLKYYIDGEELTDYTIRVPFSYEDMVTEVTMEALGSFNSRTFKKTVILKAVAAVSDLYITTTASQEVTSRTDYIDGLVSIDSYGNFNQNNLTMQIRGRGNSTWFTYDKKPYRIKFEERQSLLGMAPSRDYVLLAEYGDKSLLRNYMSHMMSSYLNLSHALETRFVNLYFNGRYDGLYLLTEQVEIDTNRLNIDTGIGSNGFLIEMDVYERLDDGAVVNLDYIVEFDRPFIIIDPNMRDFESSVVNEKITYIKNYLKQSVNAMTTSSYATWIDEEQFMDYFIIQEITKNVDVNWSSVFLHKSNDSKLKIGPLWDFDISMGNGDYYAYQPQGYWAVNNMMLSRLIQNNAFKTKYIQRFKEVIDTYQDIWKNQLDIMYLRIYDNAVDNFERWPILDTYVWPNTPEMMAANTYAEQKDYLMLWYHLRMSWLRANIDNL